jgi:predicted CXXCH cytochrome family protein
MKTRAGRLGVGIVGVNFVWAFESVWAGMVGSAHDFSGEGWSGSQICIVCHTPHSADTSQANAPLWNHETTTASYTTYSSPTMDVLPQQPRPISKLCLSCHDGSVAVDSFGGMTGGTFIVGDANLETDLSDDHPVSVEWQHQTVRTSPFCANCHFGPPREIVFFRPGGSGAIWIECATCHDVHNTTGLPNLLRRTIVSSELCLTCHEK